MADPRYRITFHRGPKRDGLTGEFTGEITENHYVERERWHGWTKVSPGLSGRDAAVAFLEAVRTPHDTKVVWEDHKKPRPSQVGPWLLVFVVLVGTTVAFVSVYKQAHKQTHEEGKKNVPNVR